MYQQSPNAALFSVVFRTRQGGRDFCPKVRFFRKKQVWWQEGVNEVELAERNERMTDASLA